MSISKVPWIRSLDLDPRGSVSMCFNTKYILL
jgi:hypothetical protein